MRSLPQEKRPGGARKRRARVRRSHTVRTVLTAAALVLALITALGVVFTYRHLNGNLAVSTAMDDIAGDQPAALAVPEGEPKPINVLIMGSDNRDGAGNNIDGLTGGGQRSDTTILLHLSADRTRAYGISIPRDSLVTRPDCGKHDQIPGGSNVMWNDAFSVGGEACTIEQFQSLTGVRVDHFVVVDFAGFRDMVDAVDGVPVCIPEPIIDPAHGINLPAGNQRIKGAQALNYVRVRYSVGDGSDISRIKRQQAFMASMANEVISAGVLARPDRLLAFLDAVTKSLTVDPGLSNLTKIAGLGLSVKDIGLDNIRFLSVPIAYFPSDSAYSGRVYWTEDADALWRKVANDKPLTRKQDEGSISAAAVPGSKPGKKPNSSANPTADANGLCA